MSTVRFLQSPAMATARNLFGLRTEQVMVRDEVAFQPSRDPYYEIMQASERMTAGLRVVFTEEEIEQLVDKDILNGRHIPAL